MSQAKDDPPAPAKETPASFEEVPATGNVMPAQSSYREMLATNPRFEEAPKSRQGFAILGGKPLKRTSQL